MNKAPKTRRASLQKIAGAKKAAPSKRLEWRHVCRVSKLLLPTAWPPLELEHAQGEIGGSSWSARSWRPGVRFGCGLKPMGSHFGVDAPPILEPILVVGLGCSLGVRPMDVPEDAVSLLVNDIYFGAYISWGLGAMEWRGGSPIKPLLSS